eukprot:TRINITY_DN28234_c0_g3_i1.p1 TRINITY_DN28234_c0_g3~~TRINITY_DN28234_c0_g3_i1.p1  ORF type:complete len:771 (+),score=209.26 TRINITY_DN28234_c0_g3_i1:58-2370(+)
MWKGAMTSSPHAARNRLLEAFRKSDFNVAAFVRDATGQGQDRLGKLTQQLEDCASSLDEELQREIVSCHEELLQSAGSVNDLDGQLGDVRSIVEALKASVARMHADVLSPFSGIKRRTELLQRMQAVNVLIRKLLRFLFDARKLRTQMEAPGKDYSKAAHTLCELESSLSDRSLERVDALRMEIAWIRETAAKIRRQAEEDLRSGLKQGNQINLSVALQVFFNLQCLRPSLLRLLGEMLEEFKNQQLAMGPGFQQSLEVNLQVLVAQTQRVYMIDELIRAKTDPLTHQTFASALQEGQGGISSLVSHFWSEATMSLKVKFGRISQDRTARRTLLAEFPKVLNALSDAADKVNMMSRGRTQALKGAEREALSASVADVRQEFLAESIKKVTEPVEMMLPDRLVNSLSAAADRGSQGGSGGADVAADELPTSHDLRRYVQLLAAELERCEACPEQLLKEAVRHVRSSVLFFATRLEQVVDPSCVDVRCFEDEVKPRLKSPLPLPAAGHARNARLFGIAHHTLASLKEAIPARFQAAVVTAQVQQTLQQTQQAIVAPMLEVLRRSYEASLLRPQAERTADGNPCLIAVGQACGHVSRYYFALFGAGQLQPYLKDLCSYAMRSFLSAACLVKPCSEESRKNLLQDMQTIETMLSSLDNEFQAHFRYEVGVFGEFRKLLFTKSIESVDFEALLNVMPLHILLTYSVHQLRPEVPSLPEFHRVSVAAYLKDTLLPLWDEKKDAVAAFKASVADLCDKHALDPTESSVVAFIMTQAV